MSTKFKITPSETAHESFGLHPDSTKNLGLDASTKTILRYGTVSHPVNTFTSDQLGLEEIALSHDVISSLRIPLSSHYEIVQNEGEIRLGPLIGFLLTQSARDFAKCLYVLNEYLQHYQHIGGTILAFSLDKVERKQQTIEGFVYNPETENWEQGTYGYPSSFFIRSSMIPKECRVHFETVMGTTIFNNFNFDKWETYQLLAAAGLKNYLPPSRLYSKPNHIQTFLERFGSLYIKPVRGSRGRSVVRVTQEKDGFSVQYRKKGKNQRLHFPKMSRMLAFFARKLKLGAYIIQKAVDLISFQERIIDFRMIMVKNGCGDWEELALIARYGAPDSVVSNISAGGLAEQGEETLQKLFGLTPVEVGQLKSQISDLAFRVAECIDHSGVHCGNMGVDIGIDTNRNIWILEIQHNNPDPTLALDAGQPSVFSRIILNQMLYLKGLAGFGKIIDRR